MNNFKIICLMALTGLFAASCHKTHGGSGTTARNVVEKPFTNPIAIPATLDATNAAFAAKPAKASIGGGTTVDALGYGGAAILGPTLRIQQGGQFKLDFKNDLAEATNIHWHGLFAPAAQDGYPTDLTPPGGSFQYSFPITNRPGTYWYHPHPDMNTASQAYRGLAGFFIVSSPEEAALNLPTGDYDVPLVVQDKRPGGGLKYEPNDDDRVIGLFGETVLVNGTAGPVLEVATRTYRLRLLNGSNARIYNFALSNGASFSVIGSDGGLLPSPEPVPSVLLSPGERADVLVYFDQKAVGDEFYLQSNTFDGAGAQGKQAFKILKFKVARQENQSSSVPATLMPVDKIPESEAIITRTFDIGHMMAHSSGGMVMHTIDGKVFDASRRDVAVNGGTTEIWEFDNKTGTEAHPMHLHGVQFQVIGRSGGRGAVQIHEKGWKDTVLALPGEKVRIITRFPDEKGKFVFHCHNLEHEDGGMMLNFEIE